MEKAKVVSRWATIRDGNAARARKREAVGTNMIATKATFDPNDLKKMRNGG